MRILIFLLALISAFFVSAENTRSKIPATSEQKPTWLCTVNSANQFTVPQDDTSACESATLSSLDTSLLPSPTDDFLPYVTLGSPSCSTEQIKFDRYRVTCKQEYHSTSPTKPDIRLFTLTSLASLTSPSSGLVYQCKTPEFPDGPYEEFDGHWCYEQEIKIEPDPDCPAPTDNDPFVFGSGSGQTSVCFPAQNGRQCEIQTDENGGYYIPASYGSVEPVSCIPDIDPSPDPDPTPDPEPKPDPDPTDPEPEANELDAINKVNENLDVLNQNQSASSESNDERLDRIALEIQNSNELLSAIKGKPVSGGSSNINNGALTEIAENTKPKEFNFNANRKQGGLNDIFTGDDLAKVEQEIEDKKTELTDYIEKIKLESKAIFDINTNISGSYTEHKETIKGAEVDLGVGRFSGFFQIIAPALIFVATVAALFIMLGGNKE